MLEIPSIITEPISEPSKSSSYPYDAGWHVVFTLEDSGGNQSSVTYKIHFHGGDIGVPVNAIYEALQGVTSCAITRIIMELRVLASDYSAPESYSQLEAKAKLRLWDDEFPGKRITLYIPSPKTGIMIATNGDGANVVDVDNEDLLTFVEQFEEGGSMFLPGEKLANGIDSGKRITRKSKRG